MRMNDNNRRDMGSDKSAHALVANNVFKLSVLLGKARLNIWYSCDLIPRWHSEVEEESEW